MQRLTSAAGVRCASCKASKLSSISVSPSTERSTAPIQTFFNTAFRSFGFPKNSRASAPPVRASSANLFALAEVASTETVLRHGFPFRLRPRRASVAWSASPATPKGGRVASPTSTFRPVRSLPLSSFWITASHISRVVGGKPSNSRSFAIDAKFAVGSRSPKVSWAVVAKAVFMGLTDANAPIIDRRSPFMKLIESGRFECRRWER